MTEMIFYFICLGATHKKEGGEGDARTPTVPFVKMLRLGSAWSPFTGVPAWVMLRLAYRPGGSTEPPRLVRA